MLRRKANNYSNPSLWYKYIHALSAFWLQRQYLHMHTNHITYWTSVRTANIKAGLFCLYFKDLMIGKCRGIDKIDGCQVICRAHLQEVAFRTSANIRQQGNLFHWHLPNEALHHPTGYEEESRAGTPMYFLPEEQVRLWECKEQHKEPACFQ